MGTPCVRAMAPVSPYGFGFATRMIAWSGLSSFATGERLSDRPLGRANCFHARSLHMQRSASHLLAAGLAIDPRPLTLGKGRISPRRAEGAEESSTGTTKKKPSVNPGWDYAAAGSNSAHRQD
ncbi:hypothetical protein TESG_08325 [Trichophyton tonsurans CBS 112818]|uniref:Uncharacterized protein n=1 Tax=Trichophyton tonsurans (strain CBS 112818) TaxID=647933 RepID=F2RSR2_TRIT1|nr:hypothetical protein TESG_08325 [Trichophyton tonsurans CBS 112818]